jgi:hypothetical protein
VVATAARQRRAVRRPSIDPRQECRQRAAVGQHRQQYAEAARAATPVVAGAAHIWVTRRNVHVDRIASAWLIQRFIDPQAAFKFVPAKGYHPAPGELRFDMFEGEFTHEGDRCTFEVLLQRSGLDEPGLTAISEIVHDIDLKDGKFARPEAGGIAALIDGLAQADMSDAERVEQGGRLFNNLYALFSTSGRNGSRARA